LAAEWYLLAVGGRRGHDRMVVVFITTYAITNVALVIADPFSKKFGFNVSYQNCCKKNIYVNDSQNLLPIDYLSNQKQRDNKKMQMF
jgi:predicted Abi (CAAX) family protease